MQVFFANIFTDTNTILLSAEESKHCIRVLRHKIGDTISVIDGKGNLYEAEITEANPQKCCAKIISKKNVSSSKNYYLHIAISPTKNADRIEWMLEKCTELGVDEFSFIICKRTEKASIKMDRLKKITESAVKQSIQTVLPIINGVQPFNEFIIKHKNTPSKHIAHCLAGEKTELKNILQNDSSIILIGPEGDFTEEEIKLALQNQFQPISLGNSRLRTETAGLLVAAAFYIR
ncbi:MAG: 16S rRNA (uracil(1498)-N(3))-methyltransferase [Bacteroidia bacterium]